MSSAGLRFSGRVIRGAGRGRQLRVPTLNLDRTCVPSELQEGIYACRVSAGGKTYPAAMHYGPRPVFKDTVSCEVHLIGTTLAAPATEIDVDVVQFLRPIQDFPSVHDLQEQMEEDIHNASSILNT